MIDLPALTETMKYVNFEPRFNGVFQETIYLEQKNGVYFINLDDKKVKEHIGFHYLLTKIQMCTFLKLSIFEIEYILQEVLNKIKDKFTKHNIFRIPPNDSIICGFYCIAFIEYKLAEKKLLDYTNLLPPNDYQKNDKIIYKYFKNKFGKRKCKP